MSGKLVMNALVMFDRETDSLWSQFLGEAIDGPLAGRRLELIPSELTSWAAWKARHPDTLVLDTDEIGQKYDPYTSYYFSESAGILGQKNVDQRLYTKELIVGIVGNGSQKAYGFRDVAQTGVVNDSFEGRGLVVAIDTDSGAAAVYERTVDGVELSFGQAGSQQHITDDGTGSTWLKATGEAVDGELAGKRLVSVPHIAAFWFAWTDFYPDTELYRP